MSTHLLQRRHDSLAERALEVGELGGDRRVCIAHDGVVGLNRDGNRGASMTVSTRGPALRSSSPAPGMLRFAPALRDSAGWRIHRGEVTALHLPLILLKERDDLSFGHRVDPALDLRLAELVGTQPFAFAASPISISAMIASSAFFRPSCC